MCALVPFITTMAILVNSMTLVGIALDRYMAVIRVFKGIWNPGYAFCFTCACLIWGLSAAISSPMMTAYFIFDVQIIITDPNNRSIPLALEVFEMCAGEKVIIIPSYHFLFDSIFARL